MNNIQFHRLRHLLPIFALVAGDDAQAALLASWKKELTRLRSHFGDTNEVAGAGDRRTNREQAK